MTSEDETFRRLRRLDFQSMDAILMSLSPAEFRYTYRTAASKAEFFRQYGWTVEEFETAKRRALINVGVIPGDDC